MASLSPDDYDAARLRAGYTHRQIAEEIIGIAERSWHSRLQKARAAGEGIKLSRLERDALYAALGLTESESGLGQGSGQQPSPLPRTLQELASAVLTLERGQERIWHVLDELDELRTLLLQREAAADLPQAQPKGSDRTSRPAP